MKNRNLGPPIFRPRNHDFIWIVTILWRQTFSHPPLWGLLEWWGLRGLMRFVGVGL